MKLIATLRNLFNNSLLNNNGLNDNGLNDNGSSTRGTSAPQSTQAADRISIEVAASRSPRPRPVNRQGHFGRNA